MNKKAMVVLSGGQDSTTCLAWAIAQGFDCYAVTFDYGQRHSVEIQAAKIIADMFGISHKHEIIELGEGILKSTSPLVSNNTLEQYADHQSLPGGLEKTFVPLRNQLFLTVAANRAVAEGCDTLITGVCQEDFGGYPDCRQVFIDSVAAAINHGLYINPFDRHGEFKFDIVTPLMNLTKAASVIMATELPGCMDALAFSHTAYDGQYPPVGHDHATLLRAKGFEEAGVADPLVVRAHNEGLMDLPDSANYNTVRQLIDNLNDNGAN